MKKYLSVFLLLLITSGMFAVTKVEVYYFHYTRRCTTCQAVEDVSKQAIAQLYAKQNKDAVVIFKSINLDDANTKKLADRCKAEGQSLLVIANGKRIDLTDQAFMNATNKPERLKKALKNAIDPLL